MGRHLEAGLIRAARYAAYAAGAVVVLALVAALVGPLFLDTPAVERELQAKLSQLVQGQIAWEKLSIRLLPSPRGSLSMVRVEIPGVVDVRAEQVDALLSLVPLLYGRAEIASVSLSKPAIRLQVSPAAKAEPSRKAPADPVEGYRLALAEVHRFAPSAVLDIEDGEVDASLPGLPPIHVSALELHGRTDSRRMEIELTAASDAWSRLKAAASVDSADLSGTGKLEVSGLKPQPWLDRFLGKSPIGVAIADASLRVDARSDGKSSLEADFELRSAGIDVQRSPERVQFPDVAVGGRVSANREEIAVRLSRAQLGPSKLEEGSVRYALKDGSLATTADFDLDLAQAMDATRRLLPEVTAKALAPIRSVSGRAQGQVKFEMRRSIWSTVVDIRQSDASVGIEGLPGPVRVAATRMNVTANGEAIALRLARAQLGASRLGEGSLRYGFKNGALTTAADFDLDLAQAMDATRRLLPEETAKSLASIQPVSGRAQGQVKFEMRRSVWNTLVDIRKSDSSVGVEGLPGPVKVAAAKVNVSGNAVRIESANVAMLDARALASATIGYGKQLRIEGSVSEGTVGKDFLAWVWKRADAPPQLALKTPIRVAVERASWSPKNPLDLVATASFDAGPAVAVDLGWTPEVLDIRRAAIKDAKSDAQIALHLEKRLLQGRFSGSLQSASIGSMLRSAKVPEGGFSGDLRSRVDLDHPERFSAMGKLAGASVDLAWLLARPVTLERFDVQADGQKLQVREASVNWAKQHFALRGEVARAADGAPIIDAQIDSPGVVVDALLRGVEAKAPAPEEKKAPKNNEPLWTEWPLPVRGQIAFGSKFVQYGERRAEPVSAILTLEEERAFLELKQVQLCGISFPLTVEAKREGLAIAVRLAAQKQQLEQTARCLTERGVEIDGEFDLSADLRTRGRVPELLPNLEGTVEAVARNGIVRKFAMLGNILTTQAVSGMFNENGPKVDERGFPYRSITAKGRFQKGSFILDESFFRSDVIGIAANGSISLIGDETRPYDSRLTVLVAPLGKLDRLVRGIPVLGYLLGGTLTSVPVGVSGDIRNPRVVPLAPGAVLGEVVGIFERTLKLPGRVLPRPAPPPSP
jgi:hypothetical protein